jgi:hypothetical protein
LHPRPGHPNKNTKITDRHDTDHNPIDDQEGDPRPISPFMKVVAEKNITEAEEQSRQTNSWHFRYDGVYREEKTKTHKDIYTDSLLPGHHFSVLNSNFVRLDAR